MWVVYGVKKTVVYTRLNMRDNCSVGWMDGWMREGERETEITYTSYHRALLVCLTAAFSNSQFFRRCRYQESLFSLFNKCVSLWCVTINVNAILSQEDRCNGGSGRRNRRRCCWCWCLVVFFLDFSHSATATMRECLFVDLLSLDYTRNQYKQWNPLTFHKIYSQLKLNVSEYTITLSMSKMFTFIFFRVWLFRIWFSFSRANVSMNICLWYVYIDRLRRTM